MKKEIKIALTAIVALVLLFIGLNFLKGINVFKSTNTYYVKFKDVAGLAVSNPVYMLTAILWALCALSTTTINAVKT